MSDNRTALLCELCRIMRDYGLDVDNAWDNAGRVAQPGKFEGEPIETLYYHSAMLNGDGEQIGDWTVFRLDATEKQVFGIDTNHIGIRETEQGFVIRAEMTEEEYQQVIDEAERESDEIAEVNSAHF